VHHFWNKGVIFNTLT